MSRDNDRRPASGPVRGRRRLIRGVLTGVLAAGLGLAGALAGGSAAFAHDFLVSTTPAADTTVTEPLSEVSLTFNEPPLTELGAGIAIEVHDQAGATVSSGEISIVDSTLAVAVTPTSTGSYTVIWQTVSSDGHPVSGEYAFDYQGPVIPPVTAAVPTATDVPTATGAAPTASASGTPATASAPPTSTPVTDAADPVAAGSPLPLVLVGVGAAVALLAAVVLVVLVTLRRRSRA